MPPFENQRQRTRRKLPAGMTVSDPDGDLLPAVPRVKVRRLMFAMVHRNDNAEKAADLRHVAIYAVLRTSTARPTSTRYTACGRLVSGNSGSRSARARCRFPGSRNVRQGAPAVAC